MINSPKPVLLVVLDGWGLAPPGVGNAISLARTPNLTSLWYTYPHTQLTASGESVGLPHGDPGDSETGHLNLGAGRIVYGDLLRINMSIADGSFYKNPALLAVSNHVQKNNSALHLMGLIGPGHVHSSIGHLFSLLYFAREQGLKKVFLHIFTDGRDAPPKSSPNFIQQIEDLETQLGVGRIASVSGRYYGMDRDNRWDRTAKAYSAAAKGEGITAQSATEAVQRSYSEGRTDEFITPTTIAENTGLPIGLVKRYDGLITFNFRPDRMRQLVKAFALPNFENISTSHTKFDPYLSKYGIKEPSNEKIQTFDRGEFIQDLFMVTMTEYERGLPVSAAFGQKNVSLPIARVLAESGLSQLHIAETEKYAHVTYFFNGGREDPFPNEEVIEIPSPRVATYDLKPEMSAHELTDTLLKKIKTTQYDFVILNFANADMVGHTGVLEAAIKGCEVVDECLGKVVKAVLGIGGACIVTADHGNAEEMINLENGEVDTEHSTSPVPFIAANEKLAGNPIMLQAGILGDIAPTILSLMGIPRPSEMTGRDLLQEAFRRSRAEKK